MIKWLAFASIALLTGCDADESIIDDYVIYDLGGSNQTLIGASGMIAIPNVTAFRLEKPYIYIEADGRLDYQTNERQPCTYFRIDTLRNLALRAAPESADYQVFSKKIKNGGRTVMDRSCVVRDKQKQAVLNQSSWMPA